MTRVEALQGLIKAEEAVRYCLKHPTGLVDMHGLVYWAGEVEKYRKEVGIGL